MVATDLKPSNTHITFLFLRAFSRQCFKCKATLEYNNLSAGQIALFLTKFCSNVLVKWINNIITVKPNLFVLVKDLTS